MFPVSSLVSHPLDLTSGAPDYRSPAHTGERRGSSLAIIRRVRAIERRRRAERE